LIVAFAFSNAKSSRLQVDMTYNFGMTPVYIR